MKSLLFISTFLLCISGVQAASTLYETQFHQTSITTGSDFLEDASVTLTTPSTALSNNLAADLLVPNLQMNGNETGWTVTFSFTATQDIVLSSLSLGFQFVNASGERHSNTDTKAGTATVTLTAGDSSATADLSFERVQADKDGTPTADIQEASFNTPVTVSAGETFTLTVNAKAPNTGGTFLGLSQLNLQGDTVPEPARPPSACLAWPPCFCAAGYNRKSVEVLIFSSVRTGLFPETALFFVEKSSQLPETFLSASS